jgi:hypothetical protein
MPVIATDISVTVDVAKYLSVTFSYSTVDFGMLTAGTSDNPALKQELGWYNVTIDTNYPYFVYAYGTDFSDGEEHTFSISNLKLDTNPSVSGLSVSDAKALSTSSQEIDNYLENVTLNYHGYWLSIPSGQYHGHYTATVTIDYISK